MSNFNASPNAATGSPDPAVGRFTQAPPYPQQDPPAPVPIAVAKNEALYVVLGLLVPGLPAPASQGRQGDRRHLARPVDPQLDPGPIPNRLRPLDRSRDLVSDRRLPGREVMEQPSRLRHLTRPKNDATAAAPGEHAGGHEKALRGLALAPEINVNGHVILPIAILEPNRR